MFVDCSDCEDGKILLFNLEHTCKTCEGTKKIERKETVDGDDDDLYYAMGIF